MANHDLELGQNSDLVLRQSHNLEVGHSNLEVGQSQGHHGLGHNPGIEIGQSQDHLGLGHNHGIDLGQSQDHLGLGSNHGIDIGQNHNHLGLGHNNGIDLGQNHELEIGHSRGLGLGQSHGLETGHSQDLGIGQNHGLEIGQNQDLGLEQSHGLEIGQNQDLGLGSSHGLEIGQHQDLDLGQSHEIGTGQSQELGLGPSHGVEIGQRQDLDLGQGHEMGIGQSQELGLAHSHNINIEEVREHDIGMGQSHDHKFSMGHLHDSELMLGHHHHNQNAHSHEGRDSNDALVLANCHEVDDPEDMDDSHNHELSLVESHGLDLAEPIGLDEQLEPLSVDDHHQLVLHHPHDMSLIQHQLVAPILQSRAVEVDPKYQITVGQEFSDVKSCRRALRDAAIACRFEIQTVKSDKTRFTAKCASDGCPWRVHAAKLPGVPTFTIRTLNDSHNCGGITHLGHQQASVQWVANSVEERLRENPNCKPKEILEEIHRVHGITLSYKQAWRGKERIMAAVRGSFEEGYRLLPQYCEQVKRTNLGSIASVYGNPDDNCFRRLFISYSASIYGFINACRPLIGLDRMLLKSKYLGTLLFATGFDGDGALFPLAFGVVDEENDENWIWFLSELRSLLEQNTENMPRLTILSDRQKGIEDGVDFNFPTAFHGYCMRHLTESFRKEFNNAVLVNLFWDAAQALTIIEFESKILEIEEISAEAAFWIRRLQPRLWATAYFEGTRFGHLTANIIESLNNWILEASSLPIIQMMECIRRQLMTWFNERREASMQWSGILVPSADQAVSDAMLHAQGLSVVRANEAEFQVISSPAEQPMIVDIRNRCCLCRGWQLYGLPCAHAAAALLSCRQQVHRFTESCFTVANYRKTYSQTIHPIPDKTMWKELSDGVSQTIHPNPDKTMWKELSDGGQNGENRIDMIINPPKSLRPPGRPRKRRVRAEDRGRVKRVVHCSRCNQTGHFRTTCAAPI